MASCTVADDIGGVEEVTPVHHSDPGGMPVGGKTMLASYYGRPFNADGYTAAHRSLPFGTELKVSYGGESVRVTGTDRGPYVAGRGLDLSLAAAQEIGLTAQGEARVRVV